MWYRTGSISVTNGSATVTGSGTAWVANAEVGEALYAPDGRLYEITNIASDTSMTITPAYLGSGQTGQSYTIVPSQSYIRDLAAQAADLVNNYSTIANTVGQGKFGDGTLTAPGIRFSDDLDTGFYRSGTNEVTFVAGGVAQFKYNTSGLQFTGGSLTSPTVTGDLSIADKIVHTGDTNTAIRFPAADTVTVETNGAERIRIDSAGQVSVGSTTLAGRTLRVAKNLTGATAVQGIQSGGTIQSDVTANASMFSTGVLTAAESFTLPSLIHYEAFQFAFGAGSTVTSQFGFQVSNSLTGATNNYGFHSNIASGTGRYNFYAAGSAPNYFAGNVGIGTSSPGAKLEVANAGAGSATTRQVTFANGIGSLPFKLSAWTGVSTNNNGDILGSLGLSFDETRNSFVRFHRGGGASDGFLSFSTNGDSERMRIDSSGNVLVGQSSQSAPGFVNQTTGIGIQPSGTIAASRSDNLALSLNRNNDGITASFRRSGTEVGTISVTTTATAYNTSSDYRLKENLVPISDALTRVAAIPVYRFNFKADPTKTVDGFVAHELAAHIPEAVTGTKDEVETVDITDDEGNVIGTEEKPVYQGVDQSKVVPLLTAAVQDLLKEVNDLKARIAILEGQ